MTSPTSHAGGLDALRFDNRFTRDLPADPNPDPAPRQVLGACYSRVDPTVVAAPRLVAHSPEVAAQLGLTDDACRTPEFAEIMAGNRLLDGMDPHAACYGGHQFGHWAGQLGDGRAINLGEVVDRAGTRQMLQLKGAGPTPYSRFADGLAVLRSSLREFLCSEAMHHLGVPTTRALSLVLTGEAVVRDVLYDGRPAAEPGAVVCRVAPSFLRLGSYEILAATDQTDLLRQLVEFTLRTQFAGISSTGSAACIDWFAEVVERTAELVVHWQRVGFVHGVLNTDNMSILGLTVDYGPYGWLDGYDPDWTPNTTDAAQHRYAFGRQPAVAQWNLARLASALLPLCGEVAPLQREIERFAMAFDTRWNAMMADKLGLDTFDAASDPELIRELLAVLQRTETDWTIFFRQLARLPREGESDDAVALLQPAYYDDAASRAHRVAIVSWLERYRARLRSAAVDDLDRQRRMDAVNPRFVLRNYLAQMAIDRAGTGDFGMVHELLDVARRPYDDQPQRDPQLFGKRPEWARHRVGCSMLSCSS
ncbi:MAG: YdiU family protein [Planctomycetes bacterium]|nr:YdiU family protein [Planctomycetota bacterium]